MFFVVVGALLLVLSLPAFHGKIRAVPVGLFGVIVPLFLFVVSAALLPEWKGACRCGWVDGFVQAKFALSPIVLFATVALYRYEVLLDGREPERWVRWGLFSGAVTSTLCLVFGFLCLDVRDLWVPLLFTCYVPLWYGWRVVCVDRPPRLDYLWNTLCMLPFWIGSGFWARRVFEALPDTKPRGCFIVTAAAGGHRFVVGPLFEVERGRTANRQLVIFWQAEDVWRLRWPVSHGILRSVYNRIAPRIAARIRSRLQADIVFLALKPVEWTLRMLLRARR